MDAIYQLTGKQEEELRKTIDAALDDAIASFDMMIVAAILSHADEDGVSDHERDQLAMIIGSDEDEDAPLARALDDTAMAANLSSFFAAVVALAAAQAGHVANSSATYVTTARETAIKSFKAAYLHESAIALTETIERMLNTPGNIDARAAQIRRVIGPSSAQARSLHAMREALRQHISDPKADAAAILAPFRGNMSAAQRQMVAKAIRAGTSPEQADALLDRHAKALRTARTKAVAGNAAHQIAETAKLTGWQAAQRFGALRADQRRYWQTAGDERVRIAHAQVPGMNSAGVPLDQPFATPLGPCFTPPLEAGCRCKVVMRLPA